MSHRVITALPLPESRLLLTFTNDEQRVFDVSPYLDKGIFTELKDPSYFSRVRVIAGHIEWPNQQDFSPDTLYLRSVPVLAGRDHGIAA